MKPATTRNERFPEWETRLCLILLLLAALLL